MPVRLGDTADLLVLLGAGASAEAGVPMSFDMTERIVELIGRNRSGDQLSEALNFVCGQLMAHQAVSGKSPYEGIDVERVFSAVELLAERSKLEVTPFVSSWHPAINTWDRPSLPTGFDSDLAAALFDQFPTDRGRDLIVSVIRAVMGNDETGATYERLARSMVQQLRSLVATRVDDLSYLSPLVWAAQQPGGLTVATLNYDLSIEQLAAERGVSVSTGIESWSGDRPWEWGDASIRLLKLHGSIDWSWQQAESIRGHITYQTVQRTPDADTSTDMRPPVVVFGQRGKMRAAGPFLSLVTEFERQLASARRLLVVGYSFRDDHVNEIIRRWTRADLARTVIIVDPNFPDNSPEGDFRRELIWGLNPWQPPNAEPRPERVTVLRSPATAALGELFWPTTKQAGQ
jgi:SIR2-like protein